MTCQNCASWTRERRRVYADLEQTYFVAPEGKGRCERLPLDTDPDFHCSMFEDGADPIKIERIDGEAWKHWDMGSCPDCNGRGCGVEGGVCGRCVGTGKVRFYADWFVGEERTRRHPKEPEPDSEAVPSVVIKDRPDVMGISA
jgi:hypothetical protein